MRLETHLVFVFCQGVMPLNEIFKRHSIGMQRSRRVDFIGAIQEKLGVLCVKDPEHPIPNDERSQKERNNVLIISEENRGRDFDTQD